MRVRVPPGKSSALAKRLLLALDRHPFYSIPAHSMAVVAVQLMCSGGDAAKVGHSVGEGVLRGLGEEKTERYPRCPHCGKRHAPLAGTAIAWAINRVKPRPGEDFGPNQ